MIPGGLDFRTSVSLLLDLLREEGFKLGMIHMVFAEGEAQILVPQSGRLGGGESLGRADLVVIPVNF